MKRSTKLFHGRRRNTPGPSVVVDDGSRSGLILRYRGQSRQWNWGSEALSEELELLAGAILSQVASDDLAAEHMAEFATDVVADFPDGGFTIADWQVEAWLQSRCARS